MTIGRDAVHVDIKLREGSHSADARLFSADNFGPSRRASPYSPGGNLLYYRIVLLLYKFGDH